MSARGELVETPLPSRSFSTLFQTRVGVILADRANRFYVKRERRATCCKFHHEKYSTGDYRRAGVRNEDRWTVSYHSSNNHFANCSRKREALRGANVISRRLSAMLHNSTFTFGRPFLGRGRSFARTKTRTAVRFQDCSAYILCMRLYSEKLLSDIRARELCLSSFPDLVVFLRAVTLVPRRVLPSPYLENSTGEGKGRRESLCTWLPISRVVGSYSRRSERT